MLIVLSIALIINILYTGILLGYAKSWNELLFVSPKNNTEEKSLPFISLIIPVRNEEENILHLISCLSKLIYPKDKFEIIFVNDHSTDRTVELITENNQGNICYSLDNTSGKKAALELGINHAIGDWIVTIDADISFDSDWLLRLIRPALTSQAVMICGLVNIVAEKESWWQSFQAMEYSVLQVAGASAIHQGRVLLNSGANLAFQKEAWKKVGGYSQHTSIASGDDTFLMLSFQKEFKNQIISNPEAIVHTKAVKSFAELLQQRKRWAGKTRFYKSPYILCVGSIVALSALFIPLLVVLPYFTITFQNWLAGVTLWIILILRGIGEWNLLGKFNKKYNSESTLGDKIRMTLIYPFFVFLLIFVQPLTKTSWKGRKL